MLGCTTSFKEHSLSFFEYRVKIHIVGYKQINLTLIFWSLRLRISDVNNVFTLPLEIF